MKKLEFLNKNVVLEEISDIITNILRIDGYDQISVKIESHPKDMEHRMFRIEASKKGTLGNSKTRLPPIKFQIRGKPNYFLIAQQWPNDHSDTIDTIFLGIAGLGIGVARSIRKKKLEKKYWKLITQNINLLKDLKKNKH